MAAPPSEKYFLLLAYPYIIMNQKKGEHVPRKPKEGVISKWSEWDRNRKIKDNVRCHNCNTLIHWRRTKTGLCNKCATTMAKGELSSNWNGGRRINTGGYVEVYHPKPHPRRFIVNNTYYVREHVLVWEKANGCYLPEGYVIHHLNGIKTDNRPENLTAVQPKDHGGWTYAQSLQKRILELEAIIETLKT